MRLPSGAGAKRAPGQGFVLVARQAPCPRLSNHINIALRCGNRFHYTMGEKAKAATAVPAHEGRQPHATAGAAAWVCGGALLGEMNQHEISQKPAGAGRATVFAGRVGGPRGGDGRQPVFIECLGRLARLARASFITAAPAEGQPAACRPTPARPRTRRRRLVGKRR